MTVRTIREGWEYSGLDADTRPSTGLKVGAVYWIKGVGKEEWDGSAWVQTSTNGETHVTTAGAAKNIVTALLYTDSGNTSVSSNDLTIDSSAAAGSKHISDATPTEAETVVELAAFTYTSGQNVKTAILSLTSGADSTLVTEVRDLLFTLNGDLIADGTKLFKGYPDTGQVLMNDAVEIKSPETAITRIGVFARTNSETATTLAYVRCEGYSHG